ncbi:unnamed protein product [Eruca vesicaria subsp. sativa]|uniref:Uncharacterized protein n=1 Tax=Eruca vesicaria subsp. sativa TaxID=29727 RepID=A0ABC8M720_ERUVS|nr:unnamed protein product [Eruca vesicaria subsp. sativa]
MLKKFDNATSCRHISKSCVFVDDLISLDFYNNNLTGKIPTSLGKLKSLVFLRLNDNQLTGPIPRELTKIPSLKVVDVSSNDLCGTIPTGGPFEHLQATTPTATKATDNI